jgi:ABC-type amino acid transport system permease subunit
MELSTMTALWWAVIVSGVYHGINPGMGWPLAVSAGLMGGKGRSLAKALGLLALGHLLAMLAILMPFAVMSALFIWEKELRIGAGTLVVLMGIYLLVNRKHPKILSRIHPAKLALWSFLAAMAHGAGLMLVPIYLGICGVDLQDAGHQAAQTLMGPTMANAVLVATVHTLAMTIAGGIIASIIYYWMGLQFLSKTWFNLDIAWALSLVLVGGLGIYGGFMGH